MYFTYVVRPGEAPEGRNPHHSPIFEFLMNYHLRLGFLLQLCSYIIILLSAYAGGKAPTSLLSFLRAHPDTIGNAHYCAVMLGCIGSVIANVHIVAFVALGDDDSSIKQSRGFRAGTKLTLQAASLGIVAWTLTLISFYAATTFFDEEWLSEQIGSGSEWLLYFTARVCDATSLMLYAGGIFLLEAYHSEGAGEAWGWLCGSLLKATCTAEIAALCLYGTNSFPVADAVYTSLLGVSLALSSLWVVIFEPISHRYDVKLSQSVIRNEYYKSRNAMAYYGPAVINANGEIDISAATQQAQASLNSNCC